jgi:hypothetical protein
VDVEELVVDGQVGQTLDHNDGGVGVVDRQGRADPGDHIVAVVVAVQEQNIAEGSGTGLVAVVAAGEIPELLVLWPETAGGAG